MKALPASPARRDGLPLIERLSGGHGHVKVLYGALTAIGTFGLLGTVSVLWENPFFVRMTPVVGFEYAQLTALSLLCGLYVVVRRPFCSNKSAGVGAVLGLTGVACPVCNKVLLLLFGSELLLTYFEPVRLEVGFVGIAIVGAAVFWELRQRRLDDKAARQWID